MTFNKVDPEAFKKILKRNVTLPLVICAALCIVFVSITLTLIETNGWVDHTNKVLTRASDTFKLVIDSETHMRGYFLSDNKNHIDYYKSSIDQADVSFRELKKLVGDNPSQIRAAEVIERDFEIWRENLERVLENERPDKTRFLQNFQVRKTLMDKIRTNINSFIETEKTLRDSRQEKTKNQTQILLTITILGSLLAGSFLAIFGRKQLLSLSSSYEESMQTQLAQNLVLTEQGWLRTGEAELSAVLLGEKTLNELATAALEYLSSYIKPTVGALFVVNDRMIERVATLAFTADQSIESKSKFKFGEGLVGDAVAKDKVIQLRDLPRDYFKVGSSLGDSSPRELIIVPLRSDGVVQAVIELGFIEPIDLQTRNFLDQISEVIGTSIKSAVYRLKLQNLLEETQTQAEELQAQQEELRVSNEELMERSQALMNAQGRLESQHAELEQTNQQLEEQKQSIDAQNKVLRESQLEVEKKSRDLEEASQYKSEFLANMSHELRTPLNSTLILSKLLKDNPHGNLSEEQVEFADNIYSSGNDLLTLINDILDLSKVEAGKLDIFMESFPVEQLTSSLQNTFRPLVNQKGLELSFEVAKDVPSQIHTDRLRVEQILKNLLSNAIKFTEKGFVRLKIELRGTDEMTFTVHDSGVGIPSEKLGVIFEAFRQADGTTNRRFGGTGLGLTISRNLSQLLGGHISASSRMGLGSSFVLALPVHPSKPVTVEAQVVQVQPQVEAPKKEVPKILNLPHIDDDAENLPAPGKKVLLVIEDDVPYAKILLSMARESKFLCVVAQTSMQGFEKALKFRPDAIVLDMQLPDGSGLSLLDRLKEDPRTRHIPVHAISASDYSREALHLGAIGYLLKPTEMKEIKETLTKLEQRINQSMKSVLIVEDDNIQRKAIEKLISDKSIQITSVGTGKDAIDKITDGKFDCVIIDLNLPDISGFDLLEQFSKLKGNELPPVIVYTGKSLSQAEEHKLRRYSQTIIIKGARSPERLLSEVTLFLHQIESLMSEEKQTILRVNRNREKAFEGRKILLVDDDVRNIFALMSMLESKGADVTIARTGIEALKALEDVKDIDLVLMDIMMPEMDGYTAIREIRKNPEHVKLPIIAVTAKAMSDDYTKCMEAGANDYLAKPVDVEKLVSLMRVWLPVI